MPHRCLECKNILESGELDLTAGCPVCGGKKFQYIRARDGQREAVKVKPETPDRKASRERIESVRILEKGNYDLNLPVLLSRKELVMSKEDGVYVVDLPSALKAPRKSKKKSKKKR